MNDWIKIDPNDKKTWPPITDENCNLDYLVHYKINDRAYTETASWWPYSPEEYFLAGCDCTFSLIKVPIKEAIYWMEMPQPPKPEGEG